MRFYPGMSPVFFVTALLLSSAPALGAAGVRHELTVGNDKREYFTYEPAGGRRSRLTVVLLHGGGGTAEGMVKFVNILPAVDREGFVLVAPQGMGRGWNDGRPEPGNAHDDLAFLRELKRDLVEKRKADPGAFFVLGMSNGGFLAMRVLCEESGLFRGYGIVAAHVGTGVARSCEPKSPVAVIRLYGDADPVVPFAGGQVKPPLGRKRGLVLGAGATDELLRSKLHCDAGKTVRAPRVPPDDGTSIETKAFVCEGGSALRTVWIKGGGHTWPGGTQYLPELLVGRVTHQLDATAECLDFFRRAALP